MAEATTAENYSALQEARNSGAKSAPERPKAEASAKHMGAGMAVLFVLTAIFIDGVEIFLDFIVIGAVLNWVIDAFAWLGFYFWLKAMGISMSEAKGMRIFISFFAFGLADTIFFGAVLGWTIFALLTVIFEFADKKS